MYRLRDDRIEHLSEVQAEALRVTHCAERLELIHLAIEFVGAALQRPDEINGTNGESRLRREGREDLHRAIAERVNLGSRHREHPDSFAAHQHRDTHDGPVTGHPLRIRPEVVRVCEHVSDLRRLPVKRDPADERSPIQKHGSIGGEFPVLRSHP